MALGGGKITVTTFPGAYIDFVTSKVARGMVGTRGVVAVIDTLSATTPTDVVVCSADEFYSSGTPLGAAYSAGSMWKYREIFKHASKVVVYNLKNTDTALADGLAALEAYDFNVLVNFSTGSTDTSTCIAKVKSWRDTLGKKAQIVVYNHATTSELNSEAVINVANSVVADEGNGVTAGGLIAWVAGAVAGCAVNKSCTNMLYDGELTVNLGQSQSELQSMLDAGKFVFHLVYGEVRVLEDINSLTTPGANQNEDFSYNQTIRVIDQIANDLAYIFNTKYLGKIINNAAGRTSLWNDIVTHHKELATMGAIENFSSEKVVVTAGESPRSVIVQDEITVSGTMSQLFMTVYLN